MEVAVLTLPRLSQISAAMLSTPVAMCAKGVMHGPKRWRWAIYAVSSRSLIVKYNWGLSSIRMLDRMEVMNVICHTYHSPEELQQNTPHDGEGGIC